MSQKVVPLYETAQDRENEERVRVVLTRAWGCHMMKLPPSYILDYGVYRDGELAALCEIKCRTFAVDRYPDLWVTGHKILAAHQWIAKGIPTIFAFGMTDGIYFFPYREDTQQQIKVGFGGRTDRNDRNDCGPMARFPISTLTRVPSDV